MEYRGPRLDYAGFLYLDVRKRGRKKKMTWGGGRKRGGGGGKKSEGRHLTLKFLFHFHTSDPWERGVRGGGGGKKKRGGGAYEKRGEEREKRGVRATCSRNPHSGILSSLTRLPLHQMSVGGRKKTVMWGGEKKKEERRREEFPSLSYSPTPSAGSASRAGKRK